MATAFNKKYISVFVDKIIPPSILDRYPNFRQFIFYFFEYLEQDGKTYDEITNIIDNIDIDAIFAEPDTTKKDNLLQLVYEQFLGKHSDRFFSSLIGSTGETGSPENEDRFLKHHATIQGTKGTKSAFQFFFLYILKGTVEITEILNSSKKHDGQYQYNGVINYDNRVGVNPFIYEITTGFSFANYENVLELLNPAGMYPIIRNKYGLLISYLKAGVTYTQSEIDAANLYIAMYNESDELIGVQRTYSHLPYGKLVNTSSTGYTSGGNEIEVSITGGNDVEYALYLTPLNPFPVGTAGNWISRLSIVDGVFEGNIKTIKILDLGSEYTDYTIPAASVLDEGVTIATVEIGDGTGNTINIGLSNIPIENIVNIDIVIALNTDQIDLMQISFPSNQLTFNVQ